MPRTHWSSDDYLDTLEQQIARAQDKFGEVLTAYNHSDVSRIEVYQRYLTFQYHLTKGVQTYFFRVAASAKLARMRKLRKFFVTFANEEELHYLVAASDLDALGLDILPEPFDVTLWHSYFHAIVDQRPFVRVGAALILENISDGSARPAVTEALSADFMTRDNTKFLVLHQHETLPHGEQLLEAVTSSPLCNADLEDLILGARRGTVLYLRMVNWALKKDVLSIAASDPNAGVSDQERWDISQFSMADLELET